MNHKEQNEKLKALWEASGKKARVEFRSIYYPEWRPIDPPYWFPESEYRIHPDDFHLCQPEEGMKLSGKQYASVQELVDESSEEVKAAYKALQSKPHSYAGPPRCEHGTLPSQCLTCSTRAAAEKGTAIELLQPDPWAYAKSIFDGDARGVLVEVHKDTANWEVCHTWQFWSVKAINDPTKVRLRPEPEKVKVHILRRLNDGTIKVCLAFIPDDEWKCVKTIEVEL